MSEANVGAFKKRHLFEKRKGESSRMRAKYPDRLPAVVERESKTHLPTIDKNKFLVPCDLTVGQFIYVIRTRLKLAPEHALFLFANSRILPPTSAMMSQIYKEHQDSDGVLYFTYSSESAFG